MSKHFIPNEEEAADIINIYLSGKGCAEVGRIYNVPYYTIDNFLKRNNIPKRQRKYTLNENYFENINTPDKAYWLGFIFAEGSLDLKRYSIGVKLGNLDREHLNKLKTSINSNAELYNVKDKFASRLSISSKIFINHLLQYCGGNKTQTLEYPDIDPIFNRDFIRGFCDGDGWISKYKNCIYVGFCSCSGNFVNSLKEIINNDLNFTNGSITIKKYKDKPWNNLYQLVYGGNISAKKVLNYLYKDCTIALTRKLVKYEEFVIG